ncbi:hypothetical protein Misp01_82740 [Microtetraspora sp. NBRC 13810]|uniref:rod shape-determining protein MreD n=1 Tax=Microtetraspora sp. NBRC 13810 TaxID=3030990 RepID=UPI0024A1AFC1|nr:rod shape-determining protein MreD [Microtetraspora sp. NBRC 13810]GLW13146.1 hypothetical protein Misp01_82740 [Microtetraspora sp. NBRC 13810]
MIVAGLLLAAMFLQVIVVNRLPLPWEAGPDLVLLVVVGCALFRTAVQGAVIGFLAGLVVDVMPPSAHPVGQYALVLCAVGFAAGRAGERGLPQVPVVIGCAVGAPLLALCVGALLGDPRVSLSSLAVTLPAAMAYNLVAAPVVVWTVVRLLGERPVRRRRLGFAVRSRT